MTQDEVSTAIRTFLTKHALAKPLMCRRETPYGWRVVFTLPTDDAADAMRAGSAYAGALGGPLFYGDARAFGAWEIQEYTAQGLIGAHITATMRVVGILGRIDRPVTHADVAAALEFETQLAA